MWELPEEDVAAVHVLDTHHGAPAPGCLVLGAVWGGATCVGVGDGVVLWRTETRGVALCRSMSVYSKTAALLCEDGTVALCDRGAV